MVSAVEWKRLEILLPKKFEKLCSLCREYQRQVEHINHITPIISGIDIQELLSKTVRIISEYLQIIQKEGEIEERTLAMIKTDIHQTLSRFYDDKTGKMKDVTSEIMHAKKTGVEKDFVPLFISPISAFIESKIYDSLIQAVEEGHQKIMSEFISNTTRKAGVHLTMKTSGSGGSSASSSGGLEGLIPTIPKPTPKEKEKAAMSDIDLSKGE